jgi:ketosteroid isomerase-like protein
MSTDIHDNRALERELRAVVDAYAQAWKEKDFAALKALWDPDVAEPIYVPEETDRVVGWDALDRYWSDCEQALDLVRAEPRELLVQRITADSALASFAMQAQWLAVGEKEPGSNPDVRVSMILRRRPDGWKLVHYVEAPFGALPLITRIYQGQVTSEFAELSRAVRASRR